MEQIFEDLAGIAPSLAQHYIHAALWPQAIRALQIAARTAKQRFAMREAAAVLQQGIEISRRLPGADQKLVELDLLDEQSRLYLGIFDSRAADAFDRLAKLAQELGLVEIEARALFGLGYVVSWSSRDRCIEIMGEAIQTSADIGDALQRSRIRCSAHSWRCWVQGWSTPDAEGFLTAHRVVVDSANRLARASADLDYSVILLAGSRYAEAIDHNRRSLTVLIDHVHRASVDLSLPLWMARLGIPWAQMSSGHLGDALDGFAAGAAACEADGEISRSATLRLYHAFAFERMHDYQTALSMVDEASALVKNHGLEFGANELKIELILRGLAHLGLGQTDEAFVHLLAARKEMEARSSLTSWYWWLVGEAGLAEAYLVVGDLEHAEICATALLTRVSAIEERTWRGFAAEICARVALARDRFAEANAFLAQGWAGIDGYDVALVRWRLHAVEAWIAGVTGDRSGQAYHNAAAAMGLGRLVSSLPPDHPCVEKLSRARSFMSMPSRSGKTAPRIDAHSVMRRSSRL
ncbi:hypothetical protein ACVDG8_038080 (plasmid) [Mesorhizobium sp. ORM8.1]